MNLRDAQPQWILAAAWAVSLVATVGSLNFSGMSSFGWDGMRLFPCELCWYQRILMYPLVAVLGVGLLRRGAPGAIRSAAWTGLALSVPGTLVALYHSFIEILPEYEIAQCSIGSCTLVQYRLYGLTIPNLSLIAFVAITAALALVLVRTGRRGGRSMPQVRPRADRDRSPDPR